MSSHFEQVRAEVRQLLKRQGLRATAARLAVLVALHEQKAPMTHEAVMEALPAGAYDKASIWRVLSDLAGVDIVRSTLFMRILWRRELPTRTFRYDARRSFARNTTQRRLPHTNCWTLRELHRIRLIHRLELLKARLFDRIDHGLYTCNRGVRCDPVA